jgi:hypothetical protein
VTRGIGPAQRRMLSVLFAFEGWAVESSELKRLVGGDRSNARRSIRTLLRRGLIHQWTEGGLRYHELVCGLDTGLAPGPRRPGQKGSRVTTLSKSRAIP